MKRTVLFPLVLSLLTGILLVSGCDFEGSARSEIRNQLQEAREKWRAQGTENYRFRYSQQRGDVIIDTVEVVVRGGSVDSIRTVPDVADDEPLVGTIASFFDLIERRIDEEDSQYGANFDNDRGFPVNYNAGFQDDRRSQDIITLEVKAQGDVEAQAVPGGEGRGRTGRTASAAEK